ncbi:MAG: T9SS type A sorting domain-containing protein, partial [Bacteroidetes bacterium]|nr:T9SS type A sorting domain-containing protein [Bacteroidota bacterium]
NFVISQIQETFGYRPVFEMPVRLKLGYAGGGDTTVTVFNNQQLQGYSFSLPDEVAGVEFDPDRWILRQAQYDPGLPVLVGESSDLSGFNLYPNPANDFIIASTEFQQDYEPVLYIYNSQGSLITSELLYPESATPINISSFKKGLYYYKICNQGETIKTGRFIRK